MAGMSAPGPGPRKPSIRRIAIKKGLPLTGGARLEKM
jgi:hypothetical protein